MLCQLIMRKGQAELTRQLCQILAICLITAQEQSRSSLSTAFSVCVAWSLCPWSLTHQSVVCSTDWWNTPPISGVFSHFHMMSWQMRTHQSVQGWASRHSQFGTCQCLVQVICPDFPLDWLDFFRESTWSDFYITRCRIFGISFYLNAFSYLTLNNRLKQVYLKRQVTNVQKKKVTANPKWIKNCPLLEKFCPLFELIAQMGSRVPRR